MRATQLLVILLFVSSVGTPAQSVAPSPDDQRLASSATIQSLFTMVRSPITFRTDDELSVAVLGIEDYAVKQKVPEDGTIIFPMIGPVVVRNLTVQQLQAVVSARLRDEGFVRNPQVSVTVSARPSMVVTVSGQVAKPGVFPAQGELTISDYISLAGGIQEILPSASPVNMQGSSIITLIRPSLVAPVVIPLGTAPFEARNGKIPVFPGDEINIGKAGVIYAVGALKSQGAFPLKNNGPTTVMQVIAMAGGVGFEGSLSDTRIVRTDQGVKSVIKVNIDSIRKGKSDDVVLRNDDILFVPSNTIKAAIKGGGAGLAVSFATAYLYTIR